MIYRAILFDLYNTLVHGASQDDRDRVSQDMAKALCVDPEAFATLVKQTVLERMRGELGTLEETVRLLAERLGARPSEPAVRLATVTRMRFIRKLVWPSPQTLSTVDGLRERGLKLAVISNCSVETVLVWPEQPLAARFHSTVFSCEIGMVKPDPAIYRVACQELGVNPAECVFVGDGEDGELDAAKALGMRAIRTLEHAYSHPGWAGESIGKLGDLSGLPG